MGPPDRQGVGRNSFNGPCYKDVDMSFAKQLTFSLGDHPALIRFQANLYNILQSDQPDAALVWQRGNHDFQRDHSRDARDQSPLRFGARRG